MKEILKKYRFWIADFKTYMYSAESFWVYMISIILVFLMAYIVTSDFIVSKFNLFDYLSFDLKAAERIAMINNRIANISTVFSISLIVVGFMINNLKQHNENFYDLIYGDIKLFPVLYFSISIIITLIILTTFRNILPSNIIINILLLSTFFIVLDLIFIILLFRKVISHLKQGNIDKLIIKHIDIISEKIKFDYKKDENLQSMNKTSEVFFEKFNIYIDEAQNTKVRNIMEFYKTLLDKIYSLPDKINYDLRNKFDNFNRHTIYSAILKKNEFVVDEFVKLINNRINNAFSYKNHTELSDYINLSIFYYHQDFLNGSSFKLYEKNATVLNYALKLDCTHILVHSVNPHLFFQNHKATYTY